MLNKVILIGRLTRDPELRYTTQNRAVTQISLAVSRNFTNQNGERQTDFINVVVWDKQAENVKKYLGKGRLVAVEGRIQTRNYDDKDGKKVYVTEVLASSVQFLESRSQVAASTGMSEMEPSQQMPSAPSQDVNPYDFTDNVETIDVDKDPFASFGENVEINDSELPF